MSLAPLGGGEHMAKTLTLRDLRYPDPFNYGDVVGPAILKGGSDKYVFLRDASKFLKEIAKHLPELTFNIQRNPGGSGIPGEASMLSSPDSKGRVVWAQLGFEPNRNQGQVLWRVGTSRYAADGVNQWVETPDAIPESVAQQIASVLSR